MIATLLSASVGVPYVVSHSQKGTLGNWSGASATASQSGAVAPAAPPHAQIQGTIVSAPGTVTNGTTTFASASGNVPLRSAPVLPIEQVLRFDLAKDWVYLQWPRKTTGPTDVGLFGVRVPLVTGTQLYDLAGSLTYFFNSAGEMEHISFRGRTGDPTRLTQFLMTTYEMEPQAAPPGEQLLQVKRSGYPQSELRTRPDAIMRASSPLSAYSVELELARPGSKRLLPERPIPLEIPTDAESPAQPKEGSAVATSGSGTTEGASGEVDSYLDSVRYATPEEEEQYYRLRWPN